MGDGFWHCYTNSTLNPQLNKNQKPWLLKDPARSGKFLKHAQCVVNWLPFFLVSNLSFGLFLYILDFLVSES